MMTLKRCGLIFAAICIAVSSCAYADEFYAPVYKTDEKEAELDVPETIDVDVTVKESRVIRTTEERQLLGVSLEWGGGNKGFMTADSSTEFKKEFLELLPELSGIHSTRTAGISLSDFKWKKAVGPMSQRTQAGESYYYTGPDNYGPTEWIKQFQLINPDCEFIVGLNVSGDTAQNLADYAEFFLGDETTAYGRLRAECGVPEPVKVGAFELGNELDGLYGEKPEKYGEKCREVILAIRERFPDAKFIMCGKTYPLENPLDDMSWRNWIIKNMEILGEYVDYISFHAYYDGQTVAWTELYLDQMQRDIKSVVGDKKIRFAFTEAAVWPRDNGIGDPPLESQTQMLTGVLSTADFLSRMFKRDDTWSSSYYCWSPSLTGNWGLLGAGEKEQKWYVSGILKMYELYDRMLGEKVLYSFAKSGNKYAIYEHQYSKYSVLATQNGDDELVLILTNKTEFKKFRTTFNFENKYRLVEETVFTAPDYESKVYGKDTKDVFTTTVTPKDEADFTEYTAPEKSLVFLRLKRTNGAGAQDEVKFEGEQQFSDLDGFWGKNEINVLAQNGILSGSGGGLFRPYDSITRAEFAQMLSNALGLESENYGSIFDDVPRGAWYEKAVYNVYKNGFMRGKTRERFCPEDNITLEELTAAAVRAYRYKNDTAEPGGGETAAVDGNGEYVSLGGFLYKDSISEWARASVAYAAEKGLLGRLWENGRFMPAEAATRGQAAVLCYRLCN